MARRSTASASLVIAGFEVNMWVALILSAVGIYAFMRLRRRRPNAQGANGTAATVAQRPGQAAASNTVRNDKPITERLADGDHKSWTVVVTSDAFFTAFGPTPAKSASKSNINAIRRLVKSCGTLIVVHMAVGGAEERESIETWAKLHLAPEGFKRHHLIFTTTAKGVEATVRQIAPTLLISRNAALCDFMSAFIPYTVAVETTAPTKPAVTVAASLDALPI
jgi:hypothetical protein